MRIIRGSITGALYIFATVYIYLSSMSSFKPEVESKLIIHYFEMFT